MNKYLKICFIFILITSCSLDKKTGFWTKSKLLKAEKDANTKIITKKDEKLDKEFNSNLKINLTSKFKENSFINNFTNNNGRIKYNGKLKSKSKFNFSKIKNFNQLDPEISFYNDAVIFFDNKGSILKFDNKSKLIWKRNYYKKYEKKLNPILFLANNEKVIVIADNISNYYALDINTGKLIWKKNSKTAFNSQVKIYKDKFFVVDFENVLRCFSIKDGKEIWKVKTEKSLIKSQKKNSLIIVRDKVFFSNSIGDISSVDIESGNLIWLTPTQDSSIYETAFFLQTSDMISDEDLIIFSNNQNEFFTLDSKSGSVKWKQKINSSLRSTIIDNLIFSVTNEGYLVIIDKNSGNIIRITALFDGLGKRGKLKTKPVGFVVGTNNIYLTTSNGKLFVVEILTGKTNSIIKIDNEKISRPFILGKNIYIVKDNSIIKLD